VQLLTGDGSRFVVTMFVFALFCGFILIKFALGYARFYVFFLFIKSEMEEALLSMGGPRIKFTCVRVPQSFPELGESVLLDLKLLSDVYFLLEQLGSAPVLSDGKVGGNCALRVSPSLLLVSKSGKYE
jgi:hypothetical protein